MTNQELLEKMMHFTATRRERAQEDVEYADDEEMKDYWRGQREAYRKMMGYIRFLCHEAGEEVEND